MEFGNGQSCDLFSLARDTSCMSWDTSFMSWDTFVCRGILLDDVIHAATHKHKNEVEWFRRQKRDALSTAFLAQLVNWQYGENSIGKNRYSVEQPGT